MPKTDGRCGHAVSDGQTAHDHGHPDYRAAFRDAAHGLLASDGVPVTVCRDSPGFIAQRIVAMIVNIGCSIAQSRTAEPADIDKAVTLGPQLPEWSVQVRRRAWRATRTQGTLVDVSNLRRSALSPEYLAYAARQTRRVAADAEP